MSTKNEGTLKINQSRSIGNSDSWNLTHSWDNDELSSATCKTRNALDEK